MGVVKASILTDFYRFLQKPLEDIFGGKITVLRGACELEKLFASHCGINALLDRQNKLAGIGFRIHYGQNDRAFTFEKDRETNAQADYDQYIMRRAYGAVTRDFNVEAYIDSERTCLLGAAVARTEEIYRCIVGKEQVCPGKRETEAENFTVDWDTLKDNGMWIHEFNQTQQEAICRK